MTYEQFRDQWAAKTARQIEREIESWRKHFAKHERAYAFHGGSLTAPGELADGRKIAALKDALEIVRHRGSVQCT